MASNTLPSDKTRIIALATQMISGLAELDTTLGITQLNPIAFQFLLDDYTSQQDSFAAARSARQTAFNNWDAAVEAVVTWLSATRGVLTARFGPTWSTHWAQTGWVNHSTAVPDRIDQQLGLALSLKTFFTNNPTYEVPSMQVTAAQANTLRNAALAAQTALASAKTLAGELDTARAESRTALLSEMRMLIGILKGVLASDDSRWMDFGLNVPASDTTPGKPLNLTVSLDSESNLLVQCDAVPLAQRYRWRMRIVGLQEKYSLAVSSVPPLAVIKTVSPGVTVEIIVQAVNGGAQGVASDPVIYTKPALEAPAPAPAEARKLEVPASRPMPHSVRAGNGHAARSR